MGKNRPPKQVRDLLVELEKCRSTLRLAPEKDGTVVGDLARLIECRPDNYESFMAEAQQLLCKIALTEEPSNLPDNDGLDEVDQDEIAWTNVCEARSQMHVALKAEADKADALTIKGRWARRQEAHSICSTDHDVGAETADTSTRRDRAGSSKRGGPIPIVPRISLAFADAATSGCRQYACPKPLARSTKQAAVATQAPQHAAAVIVWIRSFDLRIHDNPALVHAASLQRPVHLVFVWSEKEDAAQGKWRLGGTAAALWNYHSLAALDSSYQRLYGHSISFVLDESVAGGLQRVVKETGADTVVTSKAYDISGRNDDRVVQKTLHADGVKFMSFNSFLLNDVDNIRLDMSESRGHFGTLVPFLFACNAQSLPPRPEANPQWLLKAHDVNIASNIGLTGLGLCRLPVRDDKSVVDWGTPITKEWNITEEGALVALRSFFAPDGGLSRYDAERHLADASAVARISPYLRSGMLSCRTMYWEAKAAHAKDLSTTFWRRLVWRDLAYWQLGLFPRMVEEPIRSHYAGQEWNTDKNALDRWCRGRTGFPLVDAGMRELWTTGWMTQNVRMIVAIVLVEHLNINWVEGAKWFHHTLVDADPAINPMMWQNAGKSGLDQWNFTMDPGEFGRRMDPTGDYTRRWVPELRSLPARFIHCPWEAPVRLQKHIPLGVYPDRLVEDLDAAAWKSASAIIDQRARRRDRNDSGGYDTIILPKGSTLAHDGRQVRLFTKKELRLPCSEKMYDERQTNRFQSGPDNGVKPIGLDEWKSSRQQRPNDFQSVLGEETNRKRGY